MDSRSTCAYFGDSLLRLVLPFMDWERGSGDYFKAYVSPRHVLGASSGCRAGTAKTKRSDHTTSVIWFSV